MSERKCYYATVTIDEGNWRCPRCPEEFPSCSALLDHMRSHRQPSDPQRMEDLACAAGRAEARREIDYLRTQRDALFALLKVADEDRTAIMRVALLLHELERAGIMFQFWGDRVDLAVANIGVKKP